MVALHDALDADRNGSRYADHEIEVDTAVDVIESEIRYLADDGSIEELGYIILVLDIG